MRDLYLGLCLGNLVCAVVSACRGEWGWAAANGLIAAALLPEALRR